MTDHPLMKELMKKTRERQARQTVAEHVLRYYYGLFYTLEADAESLFDRVMELHAKRGQRTH